ncbi:c-type cytochrome biogenesis protein CcsB [Naasia lichenicola]|uniref:C-type cytochrome biogenesis protein CcsB n=1 Tax=Naasia lichenicola TaxID=2565933 RepID=A0A4S4FL14_9MICO|nr:c-type cytochrome biogenesis protein CcsB [Naasia lichenicola]THG31143.1 c-type cytochrome biogenesis protein CcsB [Naasia lichenicola]
MLDQYSTLFLYSAMGVYAIAFIAFTLDLSRRSAGVTARAATVQSGAERIAAARGTRVTRSAAAGSAGTTTLERPESYGPSSSDPIAPDSAGASTPLRPGKEGVSLRVGVALSILGFVLHLAADVLRGIAAARVPWANMYEFSMTGTLIIMGIFLVAVIRKDLRFLGAVITGLVLILLGISTVGFRVDVVPLPPALQSYWLVIHVMVAILATGFFTLSFALSVVQLLQARREGLGSSARAVKLRLLASVPASESLERSAYRVAIVGFILWTFTLMAGAIWAEHAWGRYWGWDTKEVWTFVIWVIYAAYIHARATRGWRGSHSAWLAIIGYSAVLFNFGVVNVFFKGLHAYSGL